MNYHSLLLSASTDESGFDNQFKKEYGRSEIRKSIKKSKKNAGKSYRNNSSRVYGKSKKHSQFTLHLIATICLDPTNPVPGWHISKNYTNGSKFVQFIIERELPEHIQFDIIDRHGAHKAGKANIDRGDPTVIEAYNCQGIYPDFIPAGMPQLNPVELCFAYVTKYLRDESPKYNSGAGWTEKNMIKVLNECRKSITFNMVQSWYIRTFNEMFPKRELPTYLDPDISVRKFRTEMKRQANEYLSKKKNSVVTRSGRVIIQNKNK